MMKRLALGYRHRPENDKIAYIIMDIVKNQFSISPYFFLRENIFLLSLLLITGFGSYLTSFHCYLLHIS